MRRKEDIELSARMLTRSPFTVLASLSLLRHEVEPDPEGKLKSLVEPEWVMNDPKNALFHYQNARIVIHRPLINRFRSFQIDSSS